MSKEPPKNEEMSEEEFSKLDWDVPGGNWNDSATQWRYFGDDEVENADFSEKK